MIRSIVPEFPYPIEETKGQDIPETFNGAITACKLGDFELAHKILCSQVFSRKPEDLASLDPYYVSFFGLTLALVEKNMDLAKKCCKIGVRSARRYPDVFLNMGQVYECANDRSRAIKIYREGYKYHPENVALLRNLQRLSPRKKRVLSFLGRSNIINRFLGRILSGK